MTTATPSAAEPFVDRAVRHHAAANGRCVDDIVQVIEMTAQLEAVKLDPATVSQTATRVLADAQGPHHPFVALAATCAAHGLGVSALQQEPRSLAEQVDEGLTLVIDQPGTPSRWLVLTAPTGGSSIVCHEVHQGRSRKLLRSADTLLSELAAEHPMADALLIEPQLLLEALSSPPGKPTGPFRKLWTLVRLERSELTSVFVYALFIGLLTLVVPVSVQALVNTIAFGSVLQPLVILGLALLAGLVVSAVLQALRHHAVEILQRRIFVRVMGDFGRRLPRWSGDAHRTRDTRELVNRFFDVATLQKSAASLAIDALGLTLQTMMGLLLLAFYHPVLLAFDVVLVMALMALILLPIRGSASTAIAESKAKYASAAWLESVADNHELLADARGARHVSSRANVLARSYLRARELHWHYLLRQIAGGLSLQVIASVALLIAGGWLVMQRQLTLGQLVAAELVVAAIGSGFGKLGKQLEKFYDATAGIDKLSQVVDVPRERDGGLHLSGDEPHSLVIRELSDPRVACDVELHVQPGETVAIYGEAASGKSVLLQMLLGRLYPAGGSICVDGIELSRIDLLRYRSDVCWLDEEVRTPDMTIAELLRLHAPEASTADLRMALRRVGLSRALTRLPDGLDQRLQPGGGPLSRNEVLRLSVARLLLQRPRLALIDGTLDALADEPELLDAVLSGRWTTLVSTRRQEVLTRAQRVMELCRAPVSDPGPGEAAATAAPEQGEQDQHER